MPRTRRTSPCTRCEAPHFDQPKSLRPRGAITRTVYSSAFGAVLLLVEPERIELSSVVCQTTVLPLNYGPRSTSRRESDPPSVRLALPQELNLTPRSYPRPSTSWWSDGESNPDLYRARVAFSRLNYRPLAPRRRGIEPPTSASYCVLPVLNYRPIGVEPQVRPASRFFPP